MEKYGALLLAASLGFGAGILFSNDRSKKVRHRGRSPSAGGYGRDGHYEGYGRLENRHSNNQLALVGPSARGHSATRTTYYPLDEDSGYGYWR